ncbi:MAG: histidine triad nucleotide-binding protein [Anaerolineales bacterium]|jgi:histidine triad (HIT) family protein
MADSIFGRILRGEAPADVIYADELCIVIKDINPQAPVHLLVIPRRPISQLSTADPDDQALLGHLLLTARQVAAEQKLDDFRLVINNGRGAGQSVFHLHVHVLGGRRFSWPPG